MSKATERTRRTRHSEPSEASLKEIPEVDFTNARVRRNPYAAGIAKEGITVQIGRGRPKKLAEVGGTSPRSVRFPNEVWKLLEARAKKRGLTLHAALREAILAWIERAA
jgi:ribbon-helix-helix CopG family protein